MLACEIQAAEPYSPLLVQPQPCCTLPVNVYLKESELSLKGHAAEEAETNVRPPLRGDRAFALALTGAPGPKGGGVEGSSRERRERVP